MSESTPAALNASPRYLRSAVSHRADEAASGRITPTLAFVAAVAVAVASLPLVDGVSSLPQAATPSASTAAVMHTTGRDRELLLLMFPPQGSRVRFCRTPTKTDGTERTVGCV